MENKTETVGDNTIKIVVTYNGKEFIYSDMLREHLDQKTLDITAWKAGKFFAATPREDRKAVSA